jgi:hypothetical protein
MTNKILQSSWLTLSGASRVKADRAGKSKGF